EDGIRDKLVTGVQTCALPIWGGLPVVAIEEPESSHGLGAGRSPLGLRRSFGHDLDQGEADGQKHRQDRGRQRAGERLSRMSAKRSEERRVGKECGDGGWTASQ